MVAVRFVNILEYSHNVKNVAVLHILRVVRFVNILDDDQDVKNVKVLRVLCILQVQINQIVKKDRVVYQPVM